MAWLLKWPRGLISCTQAQKMALQSRPFTEVWESVHSSSQRPPACPSFHPEFPPNNSSAGGWGRGRMLAKGQLGATYSRYRVNTEPATSAPKAGVHMGRGQPGILKSPLTQPRLPTHLTEALGHIIPKALFLCHLCPRSYWNREMLQGSSDPGQAHFLAKDPRVNILALVGQPVSGTTTHSAIVV